MSEEELKKHINPGEKIIEQFSVSNGYINLYSILVLVIGIVLMVISIIAGNMYGNYWFSIFLAVLTILFFIYYRFLVKKMYQYILTDKRIIAITGILNIKSISVPYHTITDMSLIENIINKWITRSGILRINTAGTDIHEMELRNIADPYRIKMKISQLTDINKSTINMLDLQSNTNVSSNDVKQV